MSLQIANRLTVDPGSSFRAKATLGVALTALMLLAPFGFVSLLSGKIALSIGTFGIVAILAANAVSVIWHHDHQNLTLYGLVPAAMAFAAGLFVDQGVVGALWCYPAILSCYGMLDEPRAYKANAMILIVAIPMSFLTLEVALAARVCATLLSVSILAIIVVRVIDEQQKQLLRQIRLDPLTGLYNRTSLPTELETTIASANGQPACLLAMDVDFFKRVNDTFGHETGDRVLCGIADILRGETPDRASVYRLGGEEFLVLLPQSDLAEALVVAEHLRRSVLHAPLVADHPVSISIGLAPLSPENDWMSWMRQGDEQLYSAKRQGRNRVVIADDVADQLLDDVSEAGVVSVKPPRPAVTSATC